MTDTNGKGPISENEKIDAIVKALGVFGLVPDSSEEQIDKAIRDKITQLNGKPASEIEDEVEKFKSSSLIVRDFFFGDDHALYDKVRARFPAVPARAGDTPSRQEEPQELKFGEIIPPAARRSSAKAEQVEVEDLGYRRYQFRPNGGNGHNDNGKTDSGNHTGGSGYSSNDAEDRFRKIIREELAKNGTVSQADFERFAKQMNDKHISAEDIKKYVQADNSGTMNDREFLLRMAEIFVASKQSDNDAQQKAGSGPAPAPEPSTAEPRTQLSARKGKPVPVKSDDKEEDDDADKKKKKKDNELSGTHMAIFKLSLLGGTAFGIYTGVAVGLRNQFGPHWFGQLLNPNGTPMVSGSIMWGAVAGAFAASLLPRTVALIPNKLGRWGAEVLVVGGIICGGAAVGAWPSPDSWGPSSWEVISTHLLGSSPSQRHASQQKPPSVAERPAIGASDCTISFMQRDQSGAAHSWNVTVTDITPKFLQEDILRETGKKVGVVEMESGPYRGAQGWVEEDQFNKLTKKCALK